MTRASAPEASTPERDIGRMVGLVGIGAWLLFALYVVVFVWISILADPGQLVRPLGAVGVLALLAGALLAASPSRTPLPMWRLVSIWGSVLLSTALLLQGLPTDAQPGFRVWELGAANFVLFAVAVRGRALGAWIGEALMIGTVAVWSQFATGSVWFGLGFSYGQPVSLVAGMAFAVGLHSVARQIFEYQDADRIRVAEAAGRAESDAQRHEGLNQVRALAEPILRAIADRRRPDRNAVVSLEASLRDRIRARQLAVEPLMSALSRMRESGAQVLLLDDSEPLLLTETERRGVAEWCVERLAEAQAASYTIRLAPDGDHLVVSVVADGGYAAEMSV